jgi:hypothetical protein
MKDAKPIKTPMGTNGHLDLDTGGKSIDQKIERELESSAKTRLPLHSIVYSSSPHRSPIWYNPHSYVICQRERK